MFTLLENGTDFSFAWNVPDVCYTNKTPIDAISSTSCGPIDHRDVEFSTYTLIALPGILLGFSALQRLLGVLASQSFGGDAPACLKAAANIIFLFAQIFLCGGFFFAVCCGSESHLDNESSCVTKCSKRVWLHRQSNGIPFRHLHCGSEGFGGLLPRNGDSETLKLRRSLKQPFSLRWSRQSFWRQEGGRQGASFLERLPSLSLVEWPFTASSVGGQAKELAKATLLEKICKSFHIYLLF